VNRTEVAALLSLMGTLDVRSIPTDDASLEAKVLVWQQTLSEHMTLAWARDAVINHYKYYSTPLLPADLNALWWPPANVSAPTEPAPVFAQIGQSVPAIESHPDLDSERPPPTPLPHVPDPKEVRCSWCGADVHVHCYVTGDPQHRLPGYHDARMQTLRIKYDDPWAEL
jgi:hypothetical protein